tara:strand:+ start:1855 stop:2814 length:960 start_codon:yes stop_codon:yes gene_type:complete
MIEKNKILLVYNTCGIKRDNTDWYIECLEGFLRQKFDGFRVVLSSCLNSPRCFKTIAKRFGNRISYCYHQEPHTVNITFNKTVQECVKEFGEFEQYVYVDSGCHFGDNPDVLSMAYESMKKNNYGMLSLQVDTDEALQAIDPTLKYESKEIQITGEDLIIPLGKACNGHVIFHSNEFLKNYNNKIWPDVFAAYCTESTFTFLCSAMGKKWAILKDLKIEHRKAVDGPSSSVPHISAKYRNPWNNLLYGRNALDFVHDKDASDAGMGYEECNNVMMHNKDAYDENELPLNPDSLKKNINKYFFLNKGDLDYNNIKCRFIK